jgi:hypothetical protein
LDKNLEVSGKLTIVNSTSAQLPLPIEKSTDQQTDPSFLFKNFSLTEERPILNLSMASAFRNLFSRVRLTKKAYFLF